ncbi:Aspartate--tRNA(Asp/Asn) ligase [Frankliniella fusca]|uniref:Aspartate--tRNA(Asp/Asn) ligase n=1 Tax=Frankliniella fusca TaxID=407009 RepID=A0AAE1HI10_9NEOP|nr:Aspartate--tRNA(Asp/Asn) ligase [Frankliniella fusca]
MSRRHDAHYTLRSRYHLISVNQLFSPRYDPVKHRVAPNKPKPSEEKKKSDIPTSDAVQLQSPAVAITETVHDRGETLRLLRLKYRFITYERGINGVAFLFAFLFVPSSDPARVP